MGLSFSAVLLSFPVDLWILFDALIWIPDATLHLVEHWLAMDLLLLYSSESFELTLEMNLNIDWYLLLDVSGIIF